MGLDMYLYARRPLKFRTKAGFDSDSGRERYLSGYEWESEEQKTEYRRLIEEADAEALADPHTPSAYISAVAVRLCAGYWRKANAVHAWFVREVQHGVDECQEADVSRAKLTELRDLCKTVLEKTEVEPSTEVYAGTSFKRDEGGEFQEERMTREGSVVVNAEIAEEYMPAQGGFFFGSTEYDDGYLADLGLTVDIIDRCLAAPPEWEFVYHSSW